VGEAEEKVERALALLRSVEAESLAVSEAVELIELVTTVPELVRRTLREAEERGIVKREGGRLIIRERAAGGSGARVRGRECDARCMRCGRRISRCFFLSLAGTELGPLGSECIRKLRLGL